MMQIETIVVGPIETNCYVASDRASGEAVVIDAGDDADLILDYLRRENLTVKYILNTHGHFDHTQANDALRAATGAPLAIHADDAELLQSPERVSAGMMIDAVGCRAPEILLHNGDTVDFGPYHLHVIYTPGHTRGGCCFYEVDEKVCFTGDTLFRGSIGRTDLYGGDHAALLKSVRDRLKLLGDDTVIYPGHGPSSVMSIERRRNPYLT